MATIYGDTSGTLGGRLGGYGYGGNQTINGTSFNDSLYGDAHKMIMGATWRYGPPLRRRRQRQPVRRCL